MSINKFKGATSVEYGLLAALIAIAAIVSLSALGLATSEMFEDTAEQLGVEAESGPGDFVPGIALIDWGPGGWTGADPVGITTYTNDGLLIDIDISDVYTNRSEEDYLMKVDFPDGNDGYVLDGPAGATFVINYGVTEEESGPTLLEVNSSQPYFTVWEGDSHAEP